VHSKTMHNQLREWREEDKFGEKIREIAHFPEVKSIFGQFVFVVLLECHELKYRDEMAYFSHTISSYLIIYSSRHHDILSLRKI